MGDDGVHGDPPAARDTQDDGDIDAPLVFQCAKCRTIVGDTFSFLFAKEDLDLIGLAKATNISVSDEVKLSEIPSLRGSSFKPFSCQQCNAGLGMVYITTTYELDAFRGVFAFERASLRSYKLGSASAVGTASLSDVHCSMDIESARQWEKARVEMLKMQHLMVAFHERLQALESGARAASGQQDAEDGNRLDAHAASAISAVHTAAAVAQLESERVAAVAAHLVSLEEEFHSFRTAVQQGRTGRKRGRPGKVARPSFQDIRPGASAPSILGIGSIPRTREALADQPIGAFSFDNPQPVAPAATAVAAAAAASARGGEEPRDTAAGSARQKASEPPRSAASSENMQD